MSYKNLKRQLDEQIEKEAEEFVQKLLQLAIKKKKEETQ